MTSRPLGQNKYLNAATNDTQARDNLSSGDGLG